MQKDLRVVFHGDDFTLGGWEEDLDWFRDQSSNKDEVKFRGRLGEGETQGSSICILNRIFEWIEGKGIWYESDPRHAEIIIRDLGLKEGSKSLSTPGSREGNEFTGEVDPTHFRALVARANYMAQDRSGTQFAVKELCKKMSDPSEEDWGKLKRLGRYLVGCPRVRLWIPFEDPV